MASNFCKLRDSGFMHIHRHPKMPLVCTLLGYKHVPVPNRGSPGVSLQALPPPALRCVVAGSAATSTRRKLCHHQHYRCVVTGSATTNTLVMPSQALPPPALVAGSATTSTLVVPSHALPPPALYSGKGHKGVDEKPMPSKPISSTTTNKEFNRIPRAP